MAAKAPTRHAMLAAMRSRRAFVLALVAGRLSTALRVAAAATPDELTTAREPIRFPDGFGAHPDTRIEWWYVTGALDAAARTWGFQITFFRASTGIAAAASSGFAARQLLFAHAAVSDLAARRLRHDQRLARSGFRIAGAERGATALKVRDWTLDRREVDGASRYAARGGERHRRVRVRSRAARDPADPPAGRRRLVAQGPSPRPGKPLLQRAAARRRRHARARRPPRRRHRPGLARP